MSTLPAIFEIDTPTTPSFNMDNYCETIAEARVQIVRFASEMIEHFTTQYNPFDEEYIEACFKDMRILLDSSIAVAKTDGKLWEHGQTHDLTERANMFIELLIDFDVEMMQAYRAILASVHRDTRAMIEKTTRIRMDSRSMIVRAKRITKPLKDFVKSVTGRWKADFHEVRPWSTH